MDATPDPVETLRSALTAAIVATPVGGTAEIVHRGVTVTVHGASRAHHAWPQPLAELTIAGVAVDGDDITSWADLAARVDEAADDAELAQHIAVESAHAWHLSMLRAEQEVTAARARRDALIRDAIEQGATAYRVAHRLGVAESTIGRINARTS